MANIFGDTEEHLLINDEDKGNLDGSDLDSPRSSKKYNKIDGFFLRTINNGIMSVQNLFLIHWTVFLLLSGFDQVFNTKCFYGVDYNEDMKEDLEFLKIYSKGLADLILWFAQVYMIINSFVLIAGLIIKSVLMCLRLPPQHIFNKIHYHVENWGIYLIFIYFTFYSACSLIVAKMDGLLANSLLVSYAALICYFFFPATRRFVYSWLPFHWGLFWFMNALDTWNAIGVSREDEFEEWFARLCIGKGLALTALYAAKAAEGVVVIVLLICVAYFRHYLKLAMKLSTVIFIVYIVGDILFGNGDEANEHNNYLFQLAVTAVIFSVHPERRGVIIKAPYDEYDGTTLKGDYLYGRGYKWPGSSIYSLVRPNASVKYFDEEASFYLGNVTNKDSY